MAVNGVGFSIRRKSIAQAHCERATHLDGHKTHANPAQHAGCQILAVLR